MREKTQQRLNMLNRSTIILTLSAGALLGLLGAVYSSISMILLLLVGVSFGLTLGWKLGEPEWLKKLF